MARRDFKLPDIGEGTAQAELVAWHVHVGDAVEEDQLLCEVMTDKATVEISSPFAGAISDRRGSPGEMLPVGSVILVFEDDVVANPATRVPVADQPATAPPLLSVQLTGTRALASPALRRRAADLGVDLANVRGCGAMAGSVKTILRRTWPVPGQTQLGWMRRPPRLQILSWRGLALAL